MKKVYEEEYFYWVVLVNPHELEWNQPQFLRDDDETSADPNGLHVFVYDSPDRAKNRCRLAKDKWPNAVPAMMTTTRKVCL